MRRGDGVRILLPAVLAAALALLSSCFDNLPGTIEVTVTSQPALGGSSGDLRIEVHEGTAGGDLGWRKAGALGAVYAAMIEHARSELIVIASASTYTRASGMPSWRR